MIAMLLVVESLCGHLIFFLSLNATLEGVYYCIQNYFCHWPSHFELFSLCFQYISLAGRFAVSYFVTLLPFNIISVVDYLAPSCYLVELFSRLIATLRVVLFAPLRLKIKLIWVKIALLRYSIQIGFCR